MLFASAGRDDATRSPLCRAAAATTRAKCRGCCCTCCCCVVVGECRRVGPTTYARLVCSVLCSVCVYYYPTALSSPGLSTETEKIKRGLKIIRIAGIVSTSCSPCVCHDDNDGDVELSKRQLDAPLSPSLSLFLLISSAKVDPHSPPPSQLTSKFASGRLMVNNNIPSTSISLDCSENVSCSVRTCVCVWSLVIGFERLRERPTQPIGMARIMS